MALAIEFAVNQGRPAELFSRGQGGYIDQWYHSGCFARLYIGNKVSALIRKITLVLSDSIKNYIRRFTDCCGVIMALLKRPTRV